MRKPETDEYLVSLNCSQVKRQQSQQSLTLLGLFGKHFELLVEKVPNYCLDARLLLPSGLRNIRLPLLPKLLSVSSVKGASRLTTGCRILDFSLPQLQLLKHLLHLTVLVTTGCSWVLLLNWFLPYHFSNELTDAVSRGTTSN